MISAGEARRDGTWLGWAPLGAALQAGQCTAGLGPSVLGWARHRVARSGEAGWARSGLARRVPVRRGPEGRGRHGSASRVMAWLGLAGLGWRARLGEADAA